MRLEHFDGERAKSVLLIYEATSLEIESLLTAFDRLRSDDPPRLIELTELPGCEAVDGCSLTLCRSSEDLGVEPAHSESKEFRCSLSQLGWAHAIAMLEPSLDPPPIPQSRYASDAEAQGWVFRGQHQSSPRWGQSSSSSRLAGSGRRLGRACTLLLPAEPRTLHALEGLHQPRTLLTARLACGWLSS
jgi:hypothetical protein